MGSTLRLELPVEGASTRPARCVLHVDEAEHSSPATRELIERLSRALAERRVRSEALRARLESGAPLALDAQYWVPGLGSAEHDPRTPERVLSVVGRLRPDLVILHHAVDARLLEALDPPGRPWRIAWFVHRHDPELTRPERLEGLARADAVLVATSFARDAIAFRRPDLAGRVHVIGLDAREGGRAADPVALVLELLESGPAVLTRSSAGLHARPAKPA